MQKNTPGQIVEFFITWMDDSPCTLAAADIAVTRSGDGVLGAGTGTLTKLADGKYSYSTSAADTNFDSVTFYASGEGTKVDWQPFETFVYDAGDILGNPVTGLAPLRGEVDLIRTDVTNVQALAEEQEYMGDGMLQGQSHLSGNTATNLRIFDSGSNYLDGGRPDTTLDHYQGFVCMMASGPNKGVTRTITTSVYDGTSSPGWVDLTFDRPMPATPGQQELFVLLPSYGAWHAYLTQLVAAKLDSLLELDGAGPAYRFTVAALAQAPAGGGGGTSDWTADQRTALSAILGIPASGTTPTDPTTGILDTIRDLVANVQTRIPAALNGGRMASHVEAMSTDSVTAASLAADAVTEIQSALSSQISSVASTLASGVALTAGERNAVALALLVLADGVETGLTLRQAMQATFAANAGLAIKSGSNIKYRNKANTLDRIDATVSGGSRTAVVLTFS